MQQKLIHMDSSTLYHSHPISTSSSIDLGECISILAECLHFICRQKKLRGIFSFFLKNFYLPVLDETTMSPNGFFLCISHT